MKSIPSRALQVNLEDYRVEVTIDPKYLVLREVMSGYEGLRKVLTTFLEELCHPRRNYQFIVTEARKFSLGYFYDLKNHPRGHEAVRLYLDIAIEAINNAREREARTDAFHNLYLLLQKFIREGGEKLEEFLPVIDYGFQQLNSLSDELFSLVVQGYYQLDRLAGAFLEHVPETENYLAINTLMKRYYTYTFSRWLSEKDPWEWFIDEISAPPPAGIHELFEPISHARMKQNQADLHDALSDEAESSSSLLKRLIRLPGYGAIVGLYRELPDRLFQTVADEKLKHQYKLIFIFHSMNVPGLSGIHEDALKEINRDITWLIENEDSGHIQKLISATFDILRRSVEIYPATVLKCVLNMGMGVYRTDESDLVAFFNRHVINLGFQSPEFTGISEDWQIKNNIAHIQNIRTWMDLIRLNPKWSKQLLSSLIIHLSLTGVLIKDTDLFPRDITQFLNSDIPPVYNLAKQLMRLFPVYFNEIGAEGRLRDISTEIDEICSRKDILVHFLRKQSHVESSNKIISLMEATLEFWRTKSKQGLQPFLPPNIYGQISESGPFIDGVHEVLNHLFREKGLNTVADLLSLEDSGIRKICSQLKEKHAADVERILLAVSFYRMLNRKYCVDHCEIDEYLNQVRSTVPIRFAGLRDVLSLRDTDRKIEGLLDFLQQLRDIILSPEAYEIREDIYRKRHIAADIPSMYGSYREAKFDALGLTFRLEHLVNTLFENLIEDFDLNFITHDTFYRIYKYLGLFNRALIADGIVSKEFELQLDLLKRSLKIKLFTFAQYRDIFRGFTQIVRNIVTEYFNNVHEQNLYDLAHSLVPEKLLPKYRRGSDSQEVMCHQIAEILLRDIIASSLGIQRLDLFLTRIDSTLHEQMEKLPEDKHYLFLTYNPENIVVSITQPPSRLNDIVHLGNKALNLIRMKALGLPVPPGFIVTTEVFRCRALIDSYKPAAEHFRKRIAKEMSHLEKITGKKFGDPRNPLLVSVRSGSAISQPGMMDSYLNVGINEAVIEGIISRTGQDWFAWDSYRRFLQSYGMSFGIPRDEFDSIIDEFKKRYGISLKKDFLPEQMRGISIAYREHVLSRGVQLQKSPEEQLSIVINRVLNSWNSEKSRTYRKIMGISDDWGTAVTVQAMVFGNISRDSGAGVLFTHSPKFPTDMLRPWGDYTIGNQGEDVVSGLVSTYPVSVYQARLEKRPEGYSLERKFPDIYQSLRNFAKLLIYDHKWAPQDIEFTFESPHSEDLFLLQTRNMETRERKRVASFENTGEMEEKSLGHGIGVSGGALSGRVVFGLDDISKWGKESPDTPLILVRGDTVPDDIKEISASDGLLTARGGATSHAAIVANRLGKTCVVGCRDLVCMEKEKQFTLNGKTIHSGEFISIDGSEGSVYMGKMKVSEG